MIGQMVSHYKILGKLGGGGMGVVYRADDTRLKRVVALKFLPSDLSGDVEAKERFIHEAQAASALDHPNICDVHEIGETEDGRLFIVMNCYEGETLKQKIGRGPMALDEATVLMVQIARGLAEAHKHGIVHRDVKPANIFVTSDGVAKIVDFGLAKLHGRTIVTKTGTTLGTIAYMSPEQALGEPVDHRSDIWSLGVVFYEMLTGKRPFESDYEQALIYSILNQDPKPMVASRPDVPAAFEKVCRWAMARSLEDRCPTAAAFIEGLESARVGVSPAGQPRLSRKMRWLAYAALGGAIVATALVGVFSSLGKGDVLDRVAVLPARNLSTDTTGDILADGMTEVVIAKLQQVASLSVPSARSAMQFKGSRESAANIARALGATVLVEASIQLVNNRVRITASLVDPTNDRSIWAETYDGGMEDILELQSRIAQAVVREVRVAIAPDAQARLGRREKKVDPEAYELYLRARREIGQFASSGPSKAAWELAMAKLQKAIEIEPDNAEYHVAVAEAYFHSSNFGLGSPEEDLRLMKAAAEKALSLDADLSSGRTSLARIELQQWNFDAALAHSSRSLELRPGNFSANEFHGLVLTLLGRFDEARAVDSRLAEMDPAEFRRTGWMVAQNLYYMRRYDEVISFLRPWLVANPQEGTVGARYILGRAYSMKGMHEAALAQCDSMGSIGPFSRPLFLAKAGRRQHALEALRDVRSKTDAQGVSVVPYDIAQMYACLQEKDSAFTYLELAFKEHAATILAIKVDPMVDNLRDDPRFKDLLRSLRLGP